MKTENNYNMFDWWKKVVFKNYANFEGRASLKEFWNFYFLTLIKNIVFFISGIYAAFNELESVFIFLLLTYIIFDLLTLLPSIAVIARRLHDINESGWFMLINIIPLFGFIILIIWLSKEGDKGTNNYGPSPKNNDIEMIENIGFKDY